ncbi:FecR family protein [Mucilaginibacter gracilis]|uniref:FecR family protein n=1 Tax=Mucilaginibacter gracilis TaxID=423350 RepID=A0A495J4T7_9SPHI|nr:FecR family protein [Mucilaginibacter gracilis]RKR83985.1 FecR family protein [Mucilaginibacter gracilis]
MFEKEFDIATLIGLYQKGEMSHDARQRLEDWLRENPANQILLNELMQENRLHSKFTKFRAIDENSGWRKVLAGISEIPHRPVKGRWLHLWPRIAASAAIVIIVSGLYFYSKNNQLSHKIHPAYVNDISPGKVGATLTLANGKEIKLSETSNGEIAKEAGVSISKSANGEVVYKIKSNNNDPNKTNTLTTAKGETYLLILPDHSKVWLNAASSLTYSANLMDHGKRRVTLKGEGYFEIAKDKVHPFIVKSNDQEVEVLGTHFNVNAYPDEYGIATTLLEGSVSVRSGRNFRMIKPGEQALNTGSSINVSEANIENVTDWKGGDFFLNHINFKVAMRKIARWYDVEVIYDASVPNELESGGWISRNNKLSEVLSAIEASGQVKFNIEGRKIRVSR